MKIKLFVEGQLHDVFEARLREMGAAINQEKNDYLLGANETLYVQHMVSRFVFQVPVIHYEKQSVSAIEKQISSRLFPRSINTNAGKTYPRQVLVIHLPVEGQIDLLLYQPSSYTLQSHEVEAKNGEISFEVINFNDDPEQLKGQIESVIRTIRPMADNIRREVEGFNASLEKEVRARLSSRKSDLQRQLGVLGQLGIPMRPSPNVPSTFAIPIAPQKVLIKPPVPTGSFAPEPTLDATIYGQILRVVQDMGRMMEQHPSLYLDKDEEALRDLFLLQLTPHFQSVTGETFNKSGKTDILVRHEGHNAFVAECKIWKGANELSKAIDQLLSYLTWRDSKTALIVFVRNKQFQKVLEVVTDTVCQHASFVAVKTHPDEGWFAFELHLPNDPSRAVHLAVMLFHFPD